MREDFNLLLSSTQKQGHELRNVADDLKKNIAETRRIDNHIDEQLGNMTLKMG